MLFLKSQTIEYYNIYKKDTVKSHIPTTLFFTDDMVSFEPLNEYFKHKVFYSRAWTSENTINNNSQHLLDFFLYVEDNELDWKQLNNDIMSQWRDNIKKEGISGKPLSNKTVNARLQAVIGFYDFAIQSGYITESPFLFKHFKKEIKSSFNQKNRMVDQKRAVSKLSESGSKIIIPTLDDVSLFLSQKMPVETQAMALLMYETGMRRSEVYSLNIDALENVLDDGSNFYEMYLDADKMSIKRNKSRKVVISKKTLMILNAWMKSNVRSKNSEKFITKHETEPKTVFITRHGNYYKNDTLNTAFRVVCENAGFNKSKITPHILRHSFATHNIVYNLDKFDGSEEMMMQWISNRLGHSSVSVTRDHYIHFVNELKIKEQKILTQYEAHLNNIRGEDA